MSQSPRSQQLLPFLNPPKPVGDPGPPCLQCGGATVISPGIGPHHQKISCTRCSSWRWAPKPRPAGRGGAA